MKKKCSDWHAAQITHAMDDVRDLDQVCLKGCEVSGIKDAAQLGVTKLPNLDLFDDTDPVLEEDFNDIPVIDFSAVLRGVSYIPNDHEIEGEKCNWLFYSHYEKNTMTFQSYDPKAIYYF